MRHTMKLLNTLVLLAVILTACGPKPTEAPPETEEAGTIKIALVLPGTINDNGWSQVAYDGVMAGATETGAEVAYTESSQLPDFESIFRDYANKGYDLVIGHGSEYADVAIKIAQEFPDTYFAVTNADVKADNVAGLDTKNEEAGYLAGFIAGVMSQTKKVGIIGAMEIVAMKRASEGFVLGVAASCPDCEPYEAWVGSFDDVGKGKETAMAMIEQGVDVIYANADAAGIGVIAGCQEKGAMVVGDTGDQSSLAPDLVITSMMQDLNPMFVEIIKEVAEGRFVANNIRMNGFDTGIYFIAPLNEQLVSEEQAAMILAEVEKVENNEIALPHMSASAEAAEPEPIKVALVLPGLANDNGWNQAAYQGVLDAQEAIGAETAYSEAVPLADYEATFRDYANQGFDLIIGHGSEFQDAALLVGEEFPETYFAITNGDVATENVAGLDFKGEELGYVAGFIAGTLTKTKIVGFVSAIEIVAFKRAEDGFYVGVEASCPDCTVLVSWVGSFDDAGKGKETALAQIEQGADVIYPIADAASLGVIQACKERGVLIIGDTGDQTPLAPDLVVTNIMQDLGPMIMMIVQEVADGAFTPNLVRLNGFDTGIYYLTPLNMALVTQEQADIILAEVEKVKAGEIDLVHRTSE